MYNESIYELKEKTPNTKLAHPVVLATKYFLNYDGTGILFTRDIEEEYLFDYLKKIFIKDYSHLSKEQFNGLLKLIISDFKITPKEVNEIEIYDEIIDFFQTKIKYELIFNNE